MNTINTINTINTMNFGPQTAAGRSLHAMKYCERGEDFREAMNRVAFGLMDSNEHYKRFREILLGMYFIPAGRIQNAIGALRQTTPYNCYVSGTIADAFTDDDGTQGSIMERAHEAAKTMRMGGGIGYDFSTLRPRGFRIGRLGSNTSGPIAFMTIFDSVCKVTQSSGHRRGAQMGVLRIDHPDIEEFIRAKQNTTSLLGFNISVAVTDEFMEAMLAEKTIELRWGNVGKVNEVDAYELWQKLMRSTHDWAEPGVLYIDAMNRMNNLYYCEKIAATNPCGEQPLPPYGACLLGSINLVKFVEKDEATGTYWFNFRKMIDFIPDIVRAMDLVVDKARYPLAEQRASAISKRRMGIGVMSLANTAEALGYSYGSASFIDFEAKVLSIIRDECYRASAMISKEKGHFPLYDEHKYLKGKFIQTLPEDVRDLIKKYGIRNSHLTSIAPTGTISMCADNVTSGIEPVFAYSMKRPIHTPDSVDPIEVTVEDYGMAFFGTKGKLARDVTAKEHIDVLCTAQQYVDSSVSKTINMTDAMPWDDFQHIYTEVWKRGGKGCTTFNKDGKRMALLTESSEEAAACTVDVQTGARDCNT